MLKLSETSLNWALKHVLLLGDTDVFPRPFEYEALNYCWPEVKATLAADDVLKWRVRPHRVALSPKSKYGFRVITQFDPLDFLILTALVYDVCNDIEGRRVPTSKNVVYSYRVKATDDGRLFDPAIGHSQFINRAQEIVHSQPDVTHVVMSDISDFYPRIYHHRLENALNVATARNNHVAAIMRLLRGWNNTETFGIPVGSAPVRLLAEAALCDVDESLLANGVNYIRFNDDYRIFARSHTEAYRHVALLADVLYRNHGLTLQKEKTHIMDAGVFEDRFVSTAARREMESLRDRFDLLIHNLNLVDAYEPIQYDKLDSEQRKSVDALNLSGILEEELKSQEPDYPLVRFIVRRFTQLDDSSLVDTLLDNLEALHPIFPDIVRYLGTLTNLGQHRQHSIGAHILHLLETSVIAELPWHRMWALHLFGRSTDWNQAGHFVRLLAECRDLLVRRKLILALGRSGQRHWFQSQWRTIFDESA